MSDNKNVVQGYTEDKDTFGILYADLNGVHKDLPPGFYTPNIDRMRGLLFYKENLNDQDLIRFTSTISDTIIKDISTFWTKEEHFKKHKFPFKRGILMFGKPGCGKSCTISLLSREVIKLGGIILDFSSVNIIKLALKEIRQRQPKAPILVLMEDLDYILKDNPVSEVLNLLDGVADAVHNVVYLATTNHPEALKENIKERPSRFDRKFNFGPPSALNRKEYFTHLFASEPITIDLDRWVNLSDGMSFAHLKEMFVSSVILGNPVEEVAKELLSPASCSSEESFEEDENEDVCSGEDDCFCSYCRKDRDSFAAQCLETAPSPLSRR